MRDIQKFDLDTRKIIDIRYNFCIGGDGNVYEARGWDAAGAHAEGWNDRSIAICMIGKFKSHPPRQTAINALKNLIAWGISLKKISPSYKMYTYNQVISSEDSEREELTDAIKALPHGGPFKYSI
ncbi:peptidoglycan-recognition protein SC2-like [Venturia canescens]|uniref:peptidoglycan-recognition protein SC2-like n=1 Tax=Venturia canescens TaxID=32260 RepID=UPI001C9C93FF|nr:peptidoglycan-recognition protein SC2-like [Venturia canescens]